ncbi:hypothetical protein BJ170DRAFT_627499 [Xylariales sp. AK1849]|nr:hypothetical protein BJ170DRAFT_627499 [Xylariales sp. AK1849]
MIDLSSRSLHRLDYITYSILVSTGAFSPFIYLLSLPHAYSADIQGYLDHLLKVGQTHASHRIPTDSVVPRCERNNTAVWDRFAGLGVHPVASDRCAFGDIDERTILQAVDERVEETHGRLPGSKSGVVEESDDACYHTATSEVSYNSSRQAWWVFGSFGSFLGSFHSF